MGESFWGFVRSSPGIPAWLVAIGFFAALFRVWPSIMAKINEGRRDKEAAKSGDWTRLRAEIERLDERNAADVKHFDERLARIEEREQDCQRQLTDALHRIGELEGYNLGLGEARNVAQAMLSEGRQADAEKRKGET